MSKCLIFINPLVINQMSQLSFLVTSGVFFIFISFFNENHVSKQKCPRWDAAIYMYIEYESLPVARGGSFY